MAKPKKADTPILVLASRVKDVIRSMDMRTDGQFVEDLSAKVHKMILDAGARAKDNKRATVKGCDLA